VSLPLVSAKVPLTVGRAAQGDTGMLLLVKLFHRGGRPVPVTWADAPLNV